MAKTFKSIKELSIAHKSVNRAIDKATREGIDKGMVWTVKYIKSHFFRSSGKPGLGYIVSRTGKLINSVRATRAKNVGKQGKIFAELLMGGRGISYAAILEYGGRTSPHLIRPRKKSVLHFFTSGGEEVFTMLVKHPGSVIEPRAPLGRGMVRGVPKIKEFTKKAHSKALKRVYG